MQNLPPALGEAEDPMVRSGNEREMFTDHHLPEKVIRVCPICYGDGIDIVLRCGHSFCHLCLSNFVLHEADDNRIYTVLPFEFFAIFTIRCPECRDDVELYRQKLPVEKPRVSVPCPRCPERQCPYYWAIDATWLFWVLHCVDSGWPTISGPGCWKGRKGVMGKGKRWWAQDPRVASTSQICWQLSCCCKRLLSFFPFFFVLSKRQVITSNK